MYAEEKQILGSELKILWPAEKSEDFTRLFGSCLCDKRLTGEKEVN